MNVRKIIFIIIIFGIMIVTTKAETYASYIDDSLGFYKIRDVTTPSNNKFSYENRTLNIDQGDSVIWINDAEKVQFTIISEQGLWNEKDSLLKIGKKFEYKFDNPGKYTFYLKEYSQRRQTIIVNSINGYSVPTVIPIVIPTVTISPTNVHIPTMIPTISPIVTTPGPVTTPSNISKVETNISKAETNISDIPEIPDIRVPDIKMPNIKFPIKISATTIAGIIVALLSMVITYIAGRNKK